MFPRVLRPRRIKFLGFFVASIGFTIIGGMMVSDGEHLGWFCAVFFGACAFVFAILLLPNSSFLKIDENGFTVCSLFRSHTYSWKDIQSFDIAIVGIQKMVVFNFSNTYKDARIARRMSVATCGYEAGLPDSFGLTPSELARLLNQYRDAAKSAD